MDDLVLLKLLGITFNQIESGVYALVLEEPESKRRLAIVIGYPEAQSIECRLQKIKTPRPLAHDLMVSLLETLEGTLESVIIHKLPTGPYAGQLSIRDELGRLKIVDARSSDAIALAIRLDAPIYTSRALIEKEGFLPGTEMNKSRISVKDSSRKKNEYEMMPIDELERRLEEEVSKENYEEALKIKKEIDKRAANNE